MQNRALKLAVIYSVMLLAVLAVTIAFKGDWLSFAYLTVSVCGIYLNSIRFRAGLLLLGAASAVYSYLCFCSRFYGDFALNIAISAYYIVFYFRWNANSTQNKAGSFKPRMWLFLTLAAAAIVPLYTLLLKHLGTAQPLLNSLSTFITCVAVIMTASRKWQQYIMWVSVNIIQILLWGSTFTPQNTAFLPIILINVFLLVMNTYNLVTWYKSHKSP